MKTETNTTYIVNESFRANSFEFGKAGNRFKLYFETAEDLKQQIDNLIQQGLYVPDETTKLKEEN